MGCDFGKEKECEIKATDALAAIERRGRLTGKLLRLSALLHHPANEDRTLAEILHINREEYCGPCVYANLKAPGASTQPVAQVALQAVADIEPVEPIEPAVESVVIQAEQDNVVVHADFRNR